MKLHQYIAHAGICSRRKAEELIKSGQISVNGQKITNVAHRLQEGDVVAYKDREIEPQAYRYILLNKPEGYVTTVADDRGRKTVFDLVRGLTERLYPVGRLDRATSGLLVLTNDGDLAQRLAHPRYQVTKKYDVVLDRPMTEKDYMRLKRGVKLDDGFIKPDRVTFVGKSRAAFAIELHSGKKRVIRRLCKALGYTVKKLDRFYYAGLTKKDLPKGQWRVLTKAEVVKLKGESDGADG